jgi:sulfopyruvate decarboxylase subunit beta
MLGSMGLASSIGLGLALSTEKKIVVIEGDGSALMNFGALATIGATQPKNYVLVIIDNGAYGSTGFQPTFTARGLKLDAVAQACNIQNTFIVTHEAAITAVMEDTMRSDQGPYCVIIKVEKGMPDDLSIIPYDAITIRDRFMESIKE